MVKNYLTAGFLLLSLGFYACGNNGSRTISGYPKSVSHEDGYLSIVLDSDDFDTTKTGLKRILASVEAEETEKRKIVDVESYLECEITDGDSIKIELHGKNTYLYDNRFKFESIYVEGHTFTFGGWW